MTLKIERIPGNDRTLIRLSGEFRSEHLDQVKAEIERNGPRVVLDLEEVDLADVDAIRFLNACEADGVEVLNCSYQAMDVSRTTGELGGSADR